MTRVTLLLDRLEREALEQLSRRERRDLRNQAAVIVRRELERLGLLQNETAPTVDTLAGETVRAAHSEPNGPVSCALEGAQHETVYPDFRP